MKTKLHESKLFMNMVIHDLRNPSESIQSGLIQAKEAMNKKIDQIILDTQQMFNQQILVNIGSNTSNLPNYRRA